MQLNSHKKKKKKKKNRRQTVGNPLQKMATLLPKLNWIYLQLTLLNEKHL